MLLPPVCLYTGDGPLLLPLLPLLWRGGQPGAVGRARARLGPGADGVGGGGGGGGGEW